LMKSQFKVFEVLHIVLSVMGGGGGDYTGHGIIQAWAR
jgi:hypothetical protein